MNLGLQDGFIIAIPIYHDKPITPRWFTGRLPEAIPINPLNHCFLMNDFPIYILIVNHPTTVTPLKLYEQLHDLFMFYHCLSIFLSHFPQFFHHFSVPEAAELPKVAVVCSVVIACRAATWAQFSGEAFGTPAIKMPRSHHCRNLKWWRWSGRKCGILWKHQGRKNPKYRIMRHFSSHLHQKISNIRSSDTKHWLKFNTLNFMLWPWPQHATAIISLEEGYFALPGDLGHWWWRQWRSHAPGSSGERCNWWRYVPILDDFLWVLWWVLPMKNGTLNGKSLK